MTGGFDLLGSLMSGSSPDEAARDTTTAAHPGAPGSSSRGRDAGAAGSADGADGAPLPCSARGCSAEAAFGLRWNNPRIHTPERRKTWLACPVHREHLTAFLSDRGFLRETVDVAELPGLDCPADAAAGRASTADRTPSTRGGDAE
ncbi:hypothetical protein FM125_00780 [Micrococcus lylae]|uniref:Acetone carboxylase n=1 Tax=Micrococcus lylae TaxID=1273 RepID=A0A1R4IAA2_9MICC|nr:MULTISPECIES: hypothetical protein [Micrococcus]WIK82881.1 hypothetical protein CJ228_003510 [Micrococcus lylae]SJN16223.1 hypothetical protein FM125_00780 [Micrococcus lylae]